MRCAWKELLSILPLRLRPEVDRRGEKTAQEVRLRLNTSPELVLDNQVCTLPGVVTEEELHFVVNTASRYSPWAAESAKHGYISGPGGHRIGLCGTVVCKNGHVDGIREISSLCIRIARDFPGIAGDVPTIGSVLILGPPGWGKTTLLRDLIRRISEISTVGVVDERGELFPTGFERGRQTDVLTGCPKPQGMDMLLKTMGPGYIAVDEITSKDDCEALLQIANCGVRLLATAHAGSVTDFCSRPIYSELKKHHVFDSFLVLHRGKHFTVERMTQ